MSGRRSLLNLLCCISIISLSISLSPAVTAAPSGRTGGPDSFGYTFTDSNTPEGPAYEWIDISDTGTAVLANTDDSWVENIDLGFFFNYYGTDYSRLAISTNGLVFSGVASGQYDNQPIGQSPGVHGFVAAFWDDIVTWNSTTSAVYYETLGTAPNRTFVVEWVDCQHYSTSPTGVTFEAVLYEGSNNIKLQYSNVSFGVVSYDNGGSATVGIEAPTEDIGLQYSFNEQVLSPGLAILFKFPAFAGTNMYLSENAPVSMDRGNTVTYSLFYSNFGSIAAPEVTLQNTLPPNVEFVSASAAGTYDASTRVVTWNIGSLPAYPAGRGSATLTVRIPASVLVGTVIQNTASVNTSVLETRYDDNSATASTTVTGSVLPPGLGVGPSNGNIGGTPSVNWGTPTTFSYSAPASVIGVDIRIHVDDGGPDIVDSMAGGPPDWTYTTTFYPRHGRTSVTYTVHEPSPYAVDFDLRGMRGFENTVTPQEIEDYIRDRVPGSPLLNEAGIGQRFVDAGTQNHVNPAFLVATAQHEGVFGTQGWAATYPDAHNTMGYGVPSGSTPPDSINSAATWGDMIDRVAWSIGRTDGLYFGSGLYTVDQIRSKYAGDPASQTVAGYMNDLAEFGGQAGDYDEDFDIYIDPAGYIYDSATGQRIAGATVWLQRPNGSGGWENVPTGQTPPVSQPDVNPQMTGPDGQYQWDVLAGAYRVHVEAPGYDAADSLVVSIPPPVTDLHVGLTRQGVANNPPVANDGGPYAVKEGGWVRLNGSGSDPEGGLLTYVWDLDNDGTFETAGQRVLFVGVDGPSNQAVVVKVTDSGGLSTTAQTTVHINNALPTADLSNNGPVPARSLATISFANATDLSTEDLAAGLHFAFACDGGALDTATYAFSSTDASTTCTFPDGPSTHIVRGRVIDKDDGYTEYATEVAVNSVSPIVSTPAVSNEPSTEGSSVAASAALTGGNEPYTCIVNYGDGSGDLPGTVSGNNCTGPAHDYSTFGLYLVTVRVTDKNGGTGSNTATHSVIFNWSGFFQPVDNLPTLNVTKAGKAIPMKFGLNGDKGLSIVAAGYPKSTQVACDSSAPQEDVQVTAGPDGSSLSYHPNTGLYKYVWKTDKGWAGTCRQLVLKLIDGTVHYANFSLR